MLDPLMEDESVEMEFEEKKQLGLQKTKTSMFDSVKTMFGK